MKIIVAGTRNLDRDAAWEALTDALEELEMENIDPSGNSEEEKGHIILSGGSGVVDKIGEDYAELANWPCRQFLPEWDVWGKAAGPIRNKTMAQEADALILIWDGKSRGSRDMLKHAKDAGLQIYERKIDRE